METEKILDGRQITVGIILAVALIGILLLYKGYYDKQTYYLETVAPYSPQYYEQLNDKLFGKFLFQSALAGGAAITLSTIILLAKNE